MQELVVRFHLLVPGCSINIDRFPPPRKRATGLTTAIGGASITSSIAIPISKARLTAGVALLVLAMLIFYRDLYLKRKLAKRGKYAYKPNQTPDQRSTIMILWNFPTMSSALRLGSDLTIFEHFLNSNGWEGNSVSPMEKMCLCLYIAAVKVTIIFQGIRSLTQFLELWMDKLPTVVSPFIAPSDSIASGG
ncbi:hypothetical protein Ancab_019974 [Ancistrocladus abbreviatus]